MCSMQEQLLGPSPQGGSECGMLKEERGSPLGCSMVCQEEKEVAV